MKPQELNQLKKYIEDLSEQGAFEIWYPAVRQQQNNVYIPYMMNDAMECFIILENAALIGSFDRELMAHTTAAIEHGDNSRHLLIIKQEHDNAGLSTNTPANICTVWFTSATIKKSLYRFDEICHYWRPGFEQWSQLTYIIGTMYDKYLWGGESVCNQTELSLMKLIEFAPFRAFAPAPELFEELYDNSKEAALLMQKLAIDAADYSFALLCKIYAAFPSTVLARLLYMKLKSSKRFSLYNHIYDLAIMGASAYPERHYMIPADNDKKEKLRKSAHGLMTKKYFVGNYPNYYRNYYKQPNDGKSVFVRFTEEHPFTIMDWEGITFSQRCMVSVCDNKLLRNLKIRQLDSNLGFFDRNGLDSYILTIDELNNSI